MLIYLQQKLENMRTKPFIRSVMVLVGGTAFAQALMILIMPVLTRIYSPTDFNILAVYTALLSLVLAVASLRYNIAIPVPEDDRDGASLLVGALLSNIAICLILLMLVIFSTDRIALALAQPGIAPYLWLVPVGVLAGSAYNVLQFWASRKKRFGLISKTRITRAVGGAGTQLGVGLTAPGPFGLLAGHAVYSGLGAVGLTSMLLRNDLGAFRGLTIAHVWSVLKRYRRFPYFSVPEALFDIGGIQIPILIIAATVIEPEAGFLVLAMQVLGAPVTLIGASVAQVYLSEAGMKLRDRKLSNFTRKTMITLFKTGAPPLLFLAVAAPFAFGPVFGSEWARSGMIVAWMTPSYILQFVASPVSMVLHVTGRQRTAMILQAVGLIVRVGAVLWATAFSEQYIVETYALASMLYYAAYIGVIVKVVRTV